MLFDDPSSSSPRDGDTRPQVATRQAPRVAFERDTGFDDGPIAPAALDETAREAERTPAGRALDPRVIESAGAPAAEALQATTIAAAVVRELYESGREVRFAFIPTRKRVSVLLCDMDGCVLSRLTPARALEIATGEPIPGARRR
jgi:hypothetical protein